MSFSLWIVAASDPEAVQYLEELQLNARSESTTWEEVGGDYAAIRAIAESRRIAINVILPYTYPGWAGPNLLSVLRGIAGELQSMDINICLEPFDAFSAYKHASAIDLFRLTQMEICITDNLTEAPHGARSDTFVSVMRQIRAPALCNLTINFNTPFFHPYIAFGQAIDAGAFPMLEAIQGTFFIGIQGARWDDIAWQAIRQKL
jgi:hypothetical protein